MIYIATPLYENKVYVPYLHGFIKAIHELTTAGMSVEYAFEKGTYIAMNRENLARSFLKTNCQFLLFIDSDIAFDTRDIMRLLASEVDVVSGVYRFRTTVPEGHPTTLPIRLLDGKYLDLESDETLQECEFVPGGMLMIRRPVIEKMYKEVPYIFNQGFDMSKNESVEDDFIGEDVHFCKLWRELGGKIHVNTKVRVGHIGEFEYRPNPRINSHDKENVLLPNR